jgi:hypothetical protein
MTRKTLKIALLALALSGAAAASAAPAMADRYHDRGTYDRGAHDRGDWDGRRDDRLDFRIAEVRDRIHDGIRRGSLTRNEASRLISELNRISYDARRADRSGRGVDRGEYMRISDRLERLEQRVYFERHDRDVAYNRRW